jgi:hypothetical protein
MDMLLLVPTARRVSHGASTELLSKRRALLDRRQNDALGAEAPQNLRAAAEASQCVRFARDLVRASST